VTRPIILGNYRLHVGLDQRGDIRDVYYPYVGYAHHVHRISLGVFSTDRMNWLRDGWDIHENHLDNLPVGVITATSRELGLKLTVTDFVHPSFDIMWRRVILENTSQRTRQARLFSYQDLHIDENPFGDTAMLDPHLKAIIHYKNDFYFAFCTDPPFDQFATGRKEWQGLEGTWKDAEDGTLSGNPISNGSVDSCFGWNFESIRPAETKNVYVFMTVARDFRGIQQLHVQARKQGYEQALNETRMYWTSWLRRDQHKDASLLKLPGKVTAVYDRSLLILCLLSSENGAMIASSDSDIERVGGDTYDYVWPRDAAWCAIALDQCGYHEITHRLFDFLFSVTTEKGYFLHKYYPTGLFGSTWHPVPFIQIDQSGIVLHAFANFYRTTGNIEFVVRHWSHVLKIANFLVGWRDRATRLPHPSWDVWEEREATTTYSASAVYGGLNAAAYLAGTIGLDHHQSKFEHAALEVKEAILQRLYEPKLGRFLRSINPRDDALDASLLAMSEFQVLPPDDPRVVATVKAIEQQLWVSSSVGGIARYSGDGYLRVSSGVVGNPWVLTTLYLATYYAETGNLGRAQELLEWSADKASSSNLLSEQVNPFDRSPVGVMPLGWSHAAYVLAVNAIIAGQS